MNNLLNDDKNKMGLIKKYFNRILPGSKKGFDIIEKDTDYFLEKRDELKEKISLRRDKRKQLLNEREQLFNKLVDTEDEFLEKELAEEIYSVENEIKILQDEHKAYMDALRVTNTIVNIKKRQSFLEERGLFGEISSLDKKEFLEIFRRTDVYEMVKKGEWELLESVLRDRLLEDESREERVKELLEKAKKERK